MIKKELTEKYSILPIPDSKNDRSNSKNHSIRVSKKLKVSTKRLNKIIESAGS